MFDNLYSRLNKWISAKQESIFVIEGPSQIGKTYFIQQYFKYKSVDKLYIDVKMHKTILERLLNDAYKSADDFYAALCFEFKTPPVVSLKILIFDGIEYCPKLRQFFKTLVKHQRVNIIAITCGGMGPLHYKGLLVPSEEDVYHMQPLSFYDFMITIGESTLAEHLKESIKKKSPVSEYLSSKIYTLFKVYNLVGGYPRSIFLYKGKKDIDACIEANKDIFIKQFEHALYFANNEDAQLMSKLRDNFSSFVFSGKYNSLKGISPYKMKQFLLFLEEEYVVNISSALDVKNQSNQSNAKKIFFSHQCFYHAICGFDRSNYFESNTVGHDVVLTDFYFNQRLNAKPLNFALDRGARYSHSDALIVNNTSIYIVEVKDKKKFVESNISLSQKSDGMIRLGVVLLNSNVFNYGEICIFPSYCSCFLNDFFTK